MKMLEWKCENFIHEKNAPILLGQFSPNELVAPTDSTFAPKEDAL